MNPLNVPTWYIDGMVFPGQEVEDSSGRVWTILLDGEEGWLGSPAPRTQRTERPNGHGSFRSIAYRGERLFRLQGEVWCPDDETREDTERELSALCGDPGRLYPFRRRALKYDLTSDVELDDSPLVRMKPGAYALEFDYQFASPDPRLHDFAWQEPISTLPVVQTLAGVGLDTLYDLDFSNGGLDFGSTVNYINPVYSRVANYGTAVAHPVFRIKGPVNNPQIEDMDTGWVIDYAGEIRANEVVTINCDSFAQRNLPGHSVISTQRGNVRSWVNLSVEWPKVDPREVKRFRLNGNGDETAELMVCLRSAWY